MIPDGGADARGMLLMAMSLVAVAAPAATVWSESSAVEKAATARLAEPAFTPPLYTINLDEPAATRWNRVAEDYKSKMSAVVDYLESVVPAWAMPLVEAIGGKLPAYFDEYGDEMVALAKALEVKPGLIAMMNLLMQMEEVGVNCSNWNVTGPTRKDDPGCVDVDPSQEWCYCHAAASAGAPMADFMPIWRARGLATAADASVGSPGLCTSIVAQTAGGEIYHGRNLDWNLPVAVRHLVLDLAVQKGGKTLFRGSGAAGFVGVFNGLSYAGRGGEGWSASINARGKGGKVFTNLLQALLHRSLTPTQHLRRVLEATSRYDVALTQLANSAQIDENYFIVAGTRAGEGAVIARARNKADDVWRLDTAKGSPDGWFRLQTNYDHWHPTPSSDDRRTPGVAAMRAMGQAALSEEALWRVLKHFPTFNEHTDYSAVIVPRAATYNATVWMG